MKRIYFILPLFLVMAACETKQQNTTEMNKEDVVIENMMNRRSIRSYTAEQITDAELEQIIECGINAPSALNKQSWEVRVIQDADFINEINNGFVQYVAGLQMQGSASRAQEPGFSVFHGAPSVILVAGNENSYSHIDCGMLGQNILLAAEAMNIGTCVIEGVIGYLNTDEAKSSVIPRLNLSEGFKPLYCISIGYKNESPDAKPRDKSKVQYIK